MGNISEKIFQTCLILSKRKILRMPDKVYLKLLYRLRFGRKLDLKHPKTFNEKLQWLKLYDRDDRYTIMVDKYMVKDYVSRKIGAQYVIPTLGVYESFEEIDFTALPDQFVIKCTHDSGGIVICTDKSAFDKIHARKFISKSLKRNYYYAAREWLYKKLVPRILVETYMMDTGLEELRDYKFFCFNGKARYFKIDVDRQTDHRSYYFDTKGRLMHFGEEVYKPDYQRNVELPHNLEEMIGLAEKLSQDIPFLRVDFYEVDGRTYFGECTFFPGAGFGKFVPQEWDFKLGELLILPEVE